MRMGLTVKILLFLTHLLLAGGVVDVEDESTFPDALPNEPWAYDVLWFQLEPEDSYVFRTKAATLVCRVASAVKVYFKCNGKVVPNKKQLFQRFTHGNTGAPITEVQLNISRDEVQEYFGPEKYRCECVAWNKRGAERSQSARVEVAYLKKYFEQSPYSKSVEIHSQTELRCIPPDGSPPPVISWLRDGRVLERGAEIDSNYIITADGHLLISQTRLSDMGNYSCVAENLAMRRISEPGLLTVYVNGGWSQWSTWSDCQGPCMKGIQKRTRLCNSPAPLNGGRPCAGSSSQKQDCVIPCPPVDGRWSAWTTWSICGPDCKQHKRRSCSTPAPAYGGKNCQGKDTMTNNCTGGLCKEFGNEFMASEPAGGTTSSTNDQAAKAIAETDIALYIGLGVAILLFTVSGLVVIRIMRRKGRDHVMYDMAPSDYPPGYFPDPTKKLGIQPDLTVSTAGSTGMNPMGLPLCYEYTYPGSVAGTAVLNKDNVLLTPDTSEHHYDVPHLHLQKQQQPHQQEISVVTATATVTALTSPSSEDNCSSKGHPTMSMRLLGSPTMTGPNASGEGFTAVTALERLPRSLSSDSMTSSSFTSSGGSGPNSILYEEANSPGRDSSPGGNGHPGSNLFRDSIASSSLLLEGLDPECVAWCTANSSGCRIALKDSAINLTIPEGALNSCEELYCALLTEEKDRPPLNDGQTLLSPVISAGPTSVFLEKPAILTFQHCAALKYGGWSVSLYHYTSNVSTKDSSSSGDSGSRGSWRKLATVGEETLQTPVFIQLDSNQVFLVSDRLERVALVGRSEPGKKAVKTLRIAVFAPASQFNQLSSLLTEYAVRVYIMDDTIAALERVMEQEKKLGGKVLDKPRSLLFQDGGENLCISLEDIGSGWRCKSPGGYQEISFSQVWGSRQSDLCCSFTLEKTERRISTICFRLLAFQHGVHLQRQTFRIRTELLSTKSRGSQQPSVPAMSSPEVTIAPRSSTVTMSSGCSSMVTLEPGSPLFRIPLTLKKKLCLILDPINPNGKDWRLLAHKLGVDRYTNFLSMKSSPTEYILDLWDVKNRKPEAVTDLLNALRLMERADAVALFEKEMGPWI